MSSNISGFQGLRTPLQSMTNGGYTLADYTNLNKVLSARITALEKAVAFNPNNVTIGGYLNIQPNSANAGNLSVTNNALVSGNLQINKTATINQNLNVGGNLSVSGTITLNNPTVNTINSTTITNSGLITSGTFSGNGAAVTNVNDTSKLPLTGGNLSGNLTLNAGTIISGNGSGLTNINDITKLPLAGGTITGNLTVNGTVTTNGQFASGSSVVNDRQVSSSYFNFQGINNAPSYTGRLYGTTNSLVLDLSDTPNANFIFYANNGVTVTNPLTITPTSVDVTGTLNMGPYNINSTGAITSLNFYGNGSGLTNIANAATATNVAYSGLTGVTPTWNQNTTGNAATATTATNVAYSGLTGTVPTWNQNTTGNAATATNVAYTGLTGVIPTWNQSTTGNAATATNVAYTGLTGTIPIWNQNTTGNAATATSATDNTKLPTAGGTMTGSLTMNAPGAFIGNGSLLSTCYYYSLDQSATTYVLPAQTVKNYHVGLNFQNSCTLQLVNLTAAGFNDQSRYLTITKIGKPSGDFTVNLTIPPASYGFYTSTTQNAPSAIMPLGVYSYTFLIHSDQRIILISQV